jgi:hypothetical protein
MDVTNSSVHRLQALFRHQDQLQVQLQVRLQVQPQAHLDRQVQIVDPSVHTEAVLKSSTMTPTAKFQVKTETGHVLNAISDTTTAQKPKNASQ